MADTKVTQFGLCQEKGITFVVKSGQTFSTVKTGVGKGQYVQKYLGEMDFLGEDILKKVISVCKRRTASAFLEKEMFSKLLKRHRG